MKKEPTPIQKTTARASLLALLAVMCCALVLRFIYVHQKNQLSSQYLNQQSILSELAALECSSLLGSAADSITAFASSGVLSGAGEEETRQLLGDLLVRLNHLGVVDLALVGSESMPVSVAGHLSNTGMTSDELKSFISEISGEREGPASVTDILQIDSPDGTSHFAVIIAVPITGSIEPAREVESQPAGTGENGNFPERDPGILAALVDVMEVHDRIRRHVPLAGTRTLFVIDRKGFFLSHPEQEFIGAQINEALNLGRYPRLHDIVKKMKQGESGTGMYFSPDRETGRKDTKWLIAWSPVANGEMSAAVTFQLSDTPLLGSLALRFSSVFVLFFAAIAAALVLFIREEKRFHALERHTNRLADTAAVNEMLTTINSDLTERKRLLENRMLTVEEKFSSNCERADLVHDKIDRLEDSLRRPSNSQKNLIDEIREELDSIRDYPENLFIIPGDSSQPVDE